MLGEIPKLFDRDFAIGYLLPAALFLAVNLWLMKVFGLYPDLLKQIGNNWLSNGIAAILAAILLLVLNLPITRFLEGYGKYNPFHLVGALEKGRYQRLAARRIYLLQQIHFSDASEADKKAFKDQVYALDQQLARRFPDELKWVLPTAFGNIVRAFEVHSRLMYGLDAISGWYRLLTVVPKDYRALIDSAKAQVDFWINLWFLSLVFVLEYFGLAYTMHQSAIAFRLPYLWAPLLSLILIGIASALAKYAAQDWGECVKGAFDVYIVDLRVKLSLPAPESMKQERALWEQLSQSLLARRPDLLPERSESPPQGDKTK